MFNPCPKPEKVEKPKKVYRIPPVSAKMEKKLKEYRPKRLLFLDLHRWCQVRGCKRRSKEIHHMEGREGDLLLDDTKWMAVCVQCHRKITDEPEWAYNERYCLLRLTVSDEKIEKE